MTSPSASFKNLIKNRLTQSVRILYIYKFKANFFFFCEVAGFLFIKTSLYETRHYFVYKCQLQTFHEKLRNVKRLDFCI